MEKKTISDEVVFILFLCYITITCRHTIVYDGKDCFSNDVLTVFVFDLF